MDAEDNLEKQNTGASKGCWEAEAEVQHHGGNLGRAQILSVK